MRWSARQRTGDAENPHRLDKQNRNAVRVARMAQQAVSGAGGARRTRACGYSGEAEYETIAAVKSAVDIPVIANGDIATPEKALRVLELTGADRVMIGRAAQGRPWIFREIEYFFATGAKLRRRRSRRYAVC